MDPEEGGFSLKHDHDPTEWCPDCQSGWLKADLRGTVRTPTVEVETPQKPTEMGKSGPPRNITRDGPPKIKEMKP
jgi:hypothetical protein